MSIAFGNIFFICYFQAVRRANRIDANQNDIVAALREAGAFVRIVSQGDGLPDLLVGYRGETLLMEVKDGDKPPSKRSLTDAEADFFANWTGGRLAVVKSPVEAVAMLNQTHGD